MHNTAQLIFDFVVGCAIIDEVTLFHMESFPKFQDEYVDRVEISLTKRIFKIFGSDGNIQELTCDSTDQFMRVLEVSKKAEEIDSEIKVVYV